MGGQDEIVDTERMWKVFRRLRIVQSLHVRSSVDLLSGGSGLLMGGLLLMLDEETNASV